ncbi:MAG: radical SAM protein [Nocardia sp.]|nr:radical SAM protein [Nocardia sp.]
MGENTVTGLTASGLGRPRARRVNDRACLPDLEAPISLIWELTGAPEAADRRRRDPRELNTAECRSLIDEFALMPGCSVRIGGGEPTARADFWELLDHATDRRVAVTFSTTGVGLTPAAATRIATSGAVEVLISLAGATEAVDDLSRGAGSYATAVRAMELLLSSGAYGFTISVVVTQHNVGQLDGFLAIANLFGAKLRLAQLRPAGAHSRDDLRLLSRQQRTLDLWLLDHGDQVLLDDPAVDGAGRAVWLVDSIGDVYSHRSVAHGAVSAGNVRADGGFAHIRRRAELSADLRAPA